MSGVPSCWPVSGGQPRATVCPFTAILCSVRSLSGAWTSSDGWFTRELPTRRRTAQGFGHGSSSGQRKMPSCLPAKSLHGGSLTSIFAGIVAQRACRKLTNVAPCLIETMVRCVFGLCMPGSPQTTRKRRTLKHPDCLTPERHAAGYRHWTTFASSAVALAGISKSCIDTALAQLLAPLLDALESRTAVAVTDLAQGPTEHEVRTQTGSSRLRQDEP